MGTQLGPCTKGRRELAGVHRFRRRSRPGKGRTSPRGSPRSGGWPKLGGGGRRRGRWPPAAGPARRGHTDGTTRLGKVLWVLGDVLD
jgi:hypothetical protein